MAFTTNFDGRRAFKLGGKSVNILYPIKKKLPVRRRGVEWMSRRPSFKLPSPRPRLFSTIKEIEDLKIRQEGIKVRLSKPLLGEVKVPKRDLNGNILKDSRGNVIFEQKPFNFGMIEEILKKTVDENIKRGLELTAVINADGKNKKEAKTEAGIILANILGRNISSMTNTVINDTAKVIKSLELSSNPQQAGLTKNDLIDGRFIAGNKWLNKDLRGAAVVYLISESLKNPLLSPERPVFDSKSKPLDVRDINSEMKEGKVLDILNKVISPDMVAARERAATPFVPKIEGVVGAPSRKIKVKRSKKPKLSSSDVAAILEKRETLKRRERREGRIGIPPPSRPRDI